MLCRWIRIRFWSRVKVIKKRLMRSKFQTVKKSCLYYFYKRRKFKAKPGFHMTNCNCPFRCRALPAFWQMHYNLASFYLVTSQRTATFIIGPVVTKIAEKPHGEMIRLFFKGVILFLSSLTVFNRV